MKKIKTNQVFSKLTWFFFTFQDQGKQKWLPKSATRLVFCLHQFFYLVPEVSLDSERKVGHKITRHFFTLRQRYFQMKRNVVYQSRTRNLLETWSFGRKALRCCCLDMNSYFQLYNFVFISFKGFFFVI